MDPGNSGGPVVDTNGHVVGVAVAIILGREIQFAVPSDRVHGLLYGRVVNMGIGQPVKTGAKITAPVKIETVDLRGQIKEVAVEVWTGKLPAGADPSRPPAITAPAAEPDDSPHKRFALRLKDGTARGNLELPPLPAGKVYWVHPTWVRKSGQTVWGAASVYKGREPLQPKTIDLRTHYQASETRRRVLLSMINRTEIADSETEISAATTTAGFSERVMNASAAEATLSLFYQGIARSGFEEKEPEGEVSLDSVRSNLKNMKARVQLDASGNPTTNQFVAAGSAVGDGSLLQFHESVKVGLDPTYLPLPNRTVKPQDTWEASRTLNLLPMARQIPMLMGAAGTLKLTCTYLGTRSRAGREEAVVALSGRVDSTGTPGKAHGQMIVDVATGTVRSVELDAIMNLPDATAIADGETRKIKLCSKLVIRLQRDL
jgi:hypothetical protein